MNDLSSLQTDNAARNSRDSRSRPQQKRAHCAGAAEHPQVLKEDSLLSGCLDWPPADWLFALPRGGTERLLLPVPSNPATPPPVGHAPSSSSSSLPPVGHGSAALAHSARTLFSLSGPPPPSRSDDITPWPPRSAAASRGPVARALPLPGTAFPAPPLPARPGEWRRPRPPEPSPGGEGLEGAAPVWHLGMEPTRPRPPGGGGRLRGLVTSSGGESPPWGRTDGGGEGWPLGEG